MSYFKAFFRKNPYPNEGKNDITIDEVLEFINLKIEENINLDYKAIGAFNNRNTIAKVLSSFANTDGGLLILGIKEKEEKDNGNTIRILPEEITFGDSIKYKKETLESRLIVDIKPSINELYIYPVRSENKEKVIYLINVEKSTKRPHMCDFKFYKRRNFSCDPMDYYDVRNMFNEVQMLREKFEDNIIRPMYSDINIILDELTYTSTHNTNVYENINRDYRYYIDTMNDKEFKNKIIVFYNLISEKSKLVGECISTVKDIINEATYNYISDRYKMNVGVLVLEAYCEYYKANLSIDGIKFNIPEILLNKKEIEIKSLDIPPDSFDCKLKYEIKMNQERQELTPLEFYKIIGEVKDTMVRLDMVNDLWAKTDEISQLGKSIIKNIISD